MNGCLIVHGLTGTPATAVSLRDALLRAGFCVSTPCLAGHGVSVGELAASTRGEWYETVRVAFSELRRESEKVYYAGLSLGALLGLKLAAEEGWGVRAMALMGTPLVLSRVNEAAIPLVRYSPLRWIIKSVPKDLDKSVADPEGRARYEETSLPMIPTRAIFEIEDLQREVFADLSKITNPVLLLHGGHDEVAPLRNVELVKNNLSSDIVETVILPNSRHVLTMDYDRDSASKAVVDFFNRFA
ncbi:MAG: alpha/beta fold hydrolase [Proteobacteria bacterium]|nr:alpha/beta fold hydrolase [Pseudomonadota bacterium]